MALVVAIAVAVAGVIGLAAVFRRRRPGGGEEGGTGQGGHENGDRAAHEGNPELRPMQRTAMLERAPSPLASGFSYCNNRNLSRR
ncbi:hypothetical protein ACOTH1_04130 [Achromobacter ruhlandii]|uniref:hypothetical protein n=1 Tax=Achromobacter ruhlandii TaxID=72557 RepID=UPI003B9D710B